MVTGAPWLREHFARQRPGTWDQLPCQVHAVLLGWKFNLKSESPSATLPKLPPLVSMASAFSAFCASGNRSLLLARAFMAHNCARSLGQNKKKICTAVCTAKCVQLFGVAAAIAILLITAVGCASRYHFHLHFHRAAYQRLFTFECNSNSKFNLNFRRTLFTLLMRHKIYLGRTATR